MTARRVAASLGLVAVCLAVAVAGAGASGSTPAASAANGCQLKSQDGAIEHVIFIDFDNTHLTRDNPNVKSNLEQMPHLLDFLKGQGTVSNKHHTVLISHTAAGILTALTGLYPDRMGATVTNSYDYYNPVTGKASFTSAFKYWTAPVVGGIDDLPNMVNGDSGTPKTTPAPWVTFTRAGCDVGQVFLPTRSSENNNSIITPQTSLALDAPSGALNIKVASVAPFRPGLTVQIDNEFVGPIEKVGTAGPGGEGLTLQNPLTQAHAFGAPVAAVDPTGDMTTIFGKGTPEWNEGKASQLAPFGSAARAAAQTDYVGIAVHCSKLVERVHEHVGPAEREDRPAPGRAGRLQRLPGAVRCEVREPGDHEGIGRRQGRLRTSDIADGFGKRGFPGFDGMSAATSLGYVAQMQEAGIPITYAYISDVHDNHAGGGAYGPGEAYVDALASYDDAFAKFFDRLAQDGIDKSNTLFVVTADENDHFVGEQAQGCNGVDPNFCVYNTGGVPASGNPKHGIFDVSNAGVTPWTGPSTWPPAAKNGPFVGEMGYNLKWPGLFGPTLNGTAFDICSTRPRASTSTGYRRWVGSRRRWMPTATSSSIRRCVR